MLRSTTYTGSQVDALIEAKYFLDRHYIFELFTRLWFSAAFIDLYGVTNTIKTMVPDPDDQSLNHHNFLN